MTSAELAAAAAAQSTDRQIWAPSVYTDSIRLFREHALREVQRVKRNLTGLSEDDQASLVRKPDEQVSKMEEAVAANFTLLDRLTEIIKEAQSEAPADTRHPPTLPAGTKPVQTLLQLFVREWSEEGKKERQACVDRLLAALSKRFEDLPPHEGKPHRVLVPGASLGRVAWEVQQLGHDTEACEGRVFHFVGAELIRRLLANTEVCKFQPFALNTCNRFCFHDHIREISIPEKAVEGTTMPPMRFGDFARLYGKASHKAGFDAVVTAFAIDTSSNIFRFVRTAAHVLREGGLWVNFGPLAYDTDHDEAHGHGLELSWEELRHAISFFFSVEEESFVDSLHAANGESMMVMQYSCIFFRAVRNEKPAPGVCLDQL